MFDFFKRSSLDNTPNNQNMAEGFFSRLKNGLSRTRQSFTHGLSSIFLGKKTIDAELLNEIEELLLTADVGLAPTDKIIKQLTDKLKRNELKDASILENTLKESLTEMLLPVQVPLSADFALDDPNKYPYVILMIGINGSGKTTTIGKIAKLLIDSGKTVLLAAGDTFRAAAIEQLSVWGSRNNVPVIAQQSGSDSASVIFDAFQAAKARRIEVLIADTAGRLHTQDNLMEELKKVTRVLKKIDPTAPHEIMLVLDASIGQNALIQAQKFHEAVKVTGITITKLDGTAKGGIIFNIADTLKLPIRFIGVGESIQDLRPFQAHEFVEALFAEEKIDTLNKLNT